MNYNDEMSSLQRAQRLSTALRVGIVILVVYLAVISPFILKEPTPDWMLAFASMYVLLYASVEAIVRCLVSIVLQGKNKVSGTEDP